MGRASKKEPTAVSSSPRLSKRLPGPIAGMAFGAALIAFPMVVAVPPSAKVLEGNLPVNAGATDLRDVSAHNSPALVRNPRDGANLAIANRIDTPSFSCALHVSLDAGISWAQTPIPVPPDEEPKCYAPNAAFGTDGTLYLSFVTLKGAQNIPNAVWITSSSDRGKTLSDPVRVLGPLAFQTGLIAHPSRRGTLFMTWLQASETGVLSFPKTGNPIQLSKSTDGGATWSSPVRVSNARRQRVVAPVSAVTTGGFLHVAYLDLGDDRLDYAGAHQGKGGEPYQGKWQLILARSTNQGADWKESVIESEITPTQRFIVFIPPTPSIALDAKGDNVYVAFHDARLGDSDVRIWSSTDRGASFSDAVRTNDTPERDKTSQYLPKLAVAPGGRVDAVYYDRRADPKNVRNEVSLQSSFDGGGTFTRRLRLSDTSFDSRVGPGVENDLPDLGTRLGLISTNDRVLGVWTDTRAGTVLSKKQDIVRAFAEIQVPEGLASSWERIFFFGGGALIVASGLFFIRRLLSAD